MNQNVNQLTAPEPAHISVRRERRALEEKVAHIESFWTQVGRRIERYEADLKDLVIQLDTRNYPDWEEAITWSMDARVAEADKTQINQKILWGEIANCLEYLEELMETRAMFQNQWLYINSLVMNIRGQ